MDIIYYFDIDIHMQIRIYWSNIPFLSPKDNCYNFNNGIGVGGVTKTYGVGVRIREREENKVLNRSYFYIVIQV